MKIESVTDVKFDTLYYHITSNQYGLHLQPFKVTLIGDGFVLNKNNDQFAIGEFTDDLNEAIKELQNRAQALVNGSPEEVDKKSGIASWAHL